MNTYTETNYQAVVERYVTVWNEPDPACRRAAIPNIWIADGAHISPSYDVHGYEQLEERIATAHDRWVANEGCIFRVLEGPAAHHGVLKFRWEMVRKGANEAEAIGADFFLLSDGGRARTIYQFIERA